MIIQFNKPFLCTAYTSTDSNYVRFLTNNLSVPTAAIFVMADVREKKLHSQFVGIVKFLFNDSVQKWLLLH
jgi:branched-subunit amino acid transport protein AzlD